MSNIKYSHNFNFDVKKDAFPYQKDAFNALKDLGYCGIFHEQGLGKTKIAIDLMIYWLEKRNIDAVLIVTKKQLVQNWENELSFHTYLRPKTLTGDKRNNFLVMNGSARILLTNFETVSAEKERIKLYLKTRNVAIVIDESTKIKNPKSKLTQNFFELSPLFKIRCIMTGTPVANRPYDMWAQIYFLDMGQSLGTNFSEFKSTADLSNDLAQNDEKKEQFEDCVSSIFEKIKDFTVRETKDSGIISLPKKKYFNEFCDFEQIQKQMYDAVREQLCILIQKGEEALLDDSESSLKRLLRLIQIASNPRLIDDFYGSISGKERRLDELLKKIISRGEKVIVWSSFIENADYFSRKYSALNPAKIHGKMAIEDRNAAVSKFKNDASCGALFATPQSAKEGLTLTVANNVIFYDRGFNLDDYLQAQDRIHRISQTKDCNVYNLMIKNSIDVWIDLLLQAKQNAAYLAQGDYKLAKFDQVMDYGYGEMVKKILGISTEDK